MKVGRTLVECWVFGIRLGGRPGAMLNEPAEPQLLPTRSEIAFYQTRQARD